LAVTKFIDAMAKRFQNPAMISTVDYHDEDYSDVVDVLENITDLTNSPLPVNDFYHGFANIVHDLVIVLVLIPSEANNQDKQQAEENLSN
jgi:hypothetical protein